MSMKSTLAACAAALACFGAAGIAHAADVSLTLEGVKDGGTLYVSLQTEDQFMQDRATAGEMISNVSGGDITVTLTGVEPGTYAFSIWHDINGNGEFDMAAEGWPEDGWAAYNGTSLRAEPAFNQVSFEVPASGFSVTERMIYPEFYKGQ